MTYRMAKRICVNAELRSAEEYAQRRVTVHEALPENPATEFHAHWTTWAEFLGVPSLYTKPEWQTKCCQLGITNVCEYNDNVTRGEVLPSRPGECFREWTNLATELLMCRKNVYY